MRQLRSQVYPLSRQQRASNPHRMLQQKPVKEHIDNLQRSHPSMSSNRHMRNAVVGEREGEINAFPFSTRVLLYSFLERKTVFLFRLTVHCNFYV